MSYKLFCLIMPGKIILENFQSGLCFLKILFVYCPGFFGEVFRGVWNGTDVAIKVFLEQDLTTENMEDFCNEISILRYFLALEVFNIFLSKYLSDIILLSILYVSM